tara:strand:+ start:81 stop:500 length:420 start_codon:yes stop_codon:yes gene_type:complete
MKDTKKLNELPYDPEFLNALGELEHRIIEDYENFSTRSGTKRTEINIKYCDKFKAGLEYLPGTKYLKIITEKSVWGFINLKNKNFKEGDILKASGWSAPALNKPRGNIFNDNYEISWTGPKYLPGSTGMPGYEMKAGTA